MRAAALFVAGLPLAAADPAYAETTKAFEVAAVIANGCAVTTIVGGAWGNINLGTVAGITSNPVQADLLGGGSAAGMQIDCTPGMTVNVTADNGNQPTAGMRRLVHGTDAASLVPYQLFANGSATPWTTQSVPLSFTVGASHVALPVRARATLSGPTRGGSYSDTVRVTLTW